jgi:hypothetical protein
MTELNAYRWVKYQNGVGAFAIVTLSVEPNQNNVNEIRDHYSGNGFTRQGDIEEVPKNGYESWKIASRKGLEFAFTCVDKFWTVDIIKIEGRAFTDTNPTVVGYTVIHAFFEKINFQLDQEKINSLEEFVMRSWTKPYQEMIPDFLNMKFEKYSIEK